MRKFVVHRTPIYPHQSTIMIVPWQAGFGLGIGYNTDASALRTEAVRFKASDRHDRPTAGVETTSFLVDSSEQYANLLNASSKVGISFSLASLETSFDLSKHLSIRKNTLHAVVLAKHQSSEPQRLGGATLLPFAKSKLQKEGPEAFHKTFGDRYIAGQTIGGRFAGIYSMTFNSMEQCAAANGSLRAAVQSLGSAGSSFSAKTEKYQHQFTSCSSVVAYGWPQPQLPNNQSPDQLWEAAQRMDATQGAPLSALLCRFTELDDYQAALHQYYTEQSRRPGLFRRCRLPALDAPGFEESESISTARERLGLESAKLRYLEKLLAAEMGATPDIHGLEALYSLVTSLRLSMTDTFKQRANLEALALRLQHHIAPAPATPVAAQWQLGQSLKEQFFRAGSLGDSVHVLLQNTTGGAQQESEWLGSLSNGVLKRVEFDGKQHLVLQSVVPSAANRKCSLICGRFAISHMDGAADKPVWVYMERHVRLFLRYYTSALMPVLAPYMVLKQYRNFVHGVWSTMDELIVSDLRDVEQVEVLQGWMESPRMGSKVVLQVTFHRTNAPAVKVPDCPDRALFKALRTETVVIPPAGQSGRVVAVSGLGNALKFHWVAQ